MTLEAGLWRNDAIETCEIHTLVGAGSSLRLAMLTDCFLRPLGLETQVGARNVGVFRDIVDRVHCQLRFSKESILDKCSL